MLKKYEEIGSHQTKKAGIIFPSLSRMSGDVQISEASLIQNREMEIIEKCHRIRFCP